MVSRAFLLNFQILAQVALGFPAQRLYLPDEEPPWRAHEKQIFVGKLHGEFWASEKNDLQAAIAKGILGKLR